MVVLQLSCDVEVAVTGSLSPTVCYFSLVAAVVQCRCRRVHRGQSGDSAVLRTPGGGSTRSRASSRFLPVSLCLPAALRGSAFQMVACDHHWWAVGQFGATRTSVFKQDKREQKKTEEIRGQVVRVSCLVKPFLLLTGEVHFTPQEQVTGLPQVQLERKSWSGRLVCLPFSRQCQIL